MQVQPGWQWKKGQNKRPKEAAQPIRAGEKSLVGGVGGGVKADYDHRDSNSFFLAPGLKIKALFTKLLHCRSTN